MKALDINDLKNLQPKSFQRNIEKVDLNLPFCIVCGKSLKIWYRIAVRYDGGVLGSECIGDTCWKNNPSLHKYKSKISREERILNTPLR